MQRIRNASDFHEWLASLKAKKVITEADFDPLYPPVPKELLQEHRGELLEALRNCIARCDRLTQLRIASIAHWCPPAEEPFSGILLQYLEDPSSEIRARAMEYIFNCFGDTTHLVTSVLRWIGDPDPRVRAGVALVLRKADHTAYDAESHLEALLRDEDARVREEAAWVFHHRWGWKTKLVPVLEALLEDADANVRAAAGGALAYLLRKGGMPWNSLMKMVHDPEAIVRRAAFVYLQDEMMKDPGTVPLLANALEDPNEQVRCFAVTGLANRRWRARKALPALRQARRRPGETQRMRWWSAAAIETIRFPWIPFRLSALVFGLLLCRPLYWVLPRRLWNRVEERVNKWLSPF